MDEKLAQQLEEILNKAEKKGLKRTMKFFRQMKALEELSQDEKAFITEQMNVHKEAVLLWLGREKAAKVLPIILFDIGRTYERYYCRRRVRDGPNET
jgi:hypothetical protein